MNRPLIKLGADDRLLAFVFALLVVVCCVGCPVGVDHGKSKPPINVVPDKVALADVWAITVEETADRPKHLEQSAVIADLKFWDATLPSRWRHYDKDSDAGRKYLPTIGVTPLPALIVAAKQSSGSLKTLKVVTVPASTADVSKLLGEVAK